MSAIAVTLPDEATLHEAARQAHASHLHLVIDHTDGQIKLTPFVTPDMQVIFVKDKQFDHREAA